MAQAGLHALKYLGWQFAARISHLKLYIRKVYCFVNQTQILIFFQKICGFTVCLTKRAVDPPLADGTRTDSKNMFVAPETHTDGSAGN